MPKEHISDPEMSKILDFMNIEAERISEWKPEGHSLRMKDEPVNMMLLKSLEPGSPWAAKVDKTGKATFTMETPEMEAQKKAAGETKTKETPEGTSKETPTPTADPRIPFSAYASMMAPPTGPSAAELRGLAPEQVMAVMDATGAAREAGRRTLADVEGWGLREAQRGLLEAQVKKALRPAVPPLTFEQRKELKRTGPPKAPKEPSMFEKKIPITAHDTMVEAIMNKDSELYDYPDVARVTAANKVFGKHGLEIIGVDIDEAKRTGWFGIDWLAKDIPAQTILVVTDIGKEPTRKQIEESLVSYYGWSPEEVKKAKVAEPKPKKGRKKK